MSSRVAVVTGANKGIGLQIVRSLCRHFGQDGVVYLTARNEGRGRAAVELLQNEGLNTRFSALDVTDQSSIDKLRDHLKKEHGGIDILVNNAGVYLSDDIPLSEKFQPVMDVNFFGLRAVCLELIPLVRSGGRIVNVASWNAYRTFREDFNNDLKEKFRRVRDEEDVLELMNQYIAACRVGRSVENGWTDSPYSISKLGVVILSKVLAEQLLQDGTKENILLNCCCPGRVDTDMCASLKGLKLTIKEGADTPSFLALLPPDAKEPNGQFLMRRKVFDFINTDVIVPLFETKAEIGIN